MSETNTKESNQNKSDEVMTASQLKDHFLKIAQPLVEQYVGAALGTAELASTNMNAREEVWDVIKKLMLKSSIKVSRNITSAEDVILAVTSGECTIEEGKDLLELYKKMREIKEPMIVPGSIGSGQGGITVNILASGVKEIEAPRIEEPLDVKVIDVPKG